MILNLCKSFCNGPLQRCVMLASWHAFKACFGRVASCALHGLRRTDFFAGSPTFVAALMALVVLVPAQAATSFPKLDIGKGGQCVEDPQWMRKNHMQVLLHQRDETVHQGIRDGKYSLKNCVECHASTRDDSVLGHPDSFCEGCHRYEAVKIDCFECHSSKRASSLVQKESK